MIWCNKLGNAIIYMALTRFVIFKSCKVFLCFSLIINLLFRCSFRVFNFFSKTFQLCFKFMILNLHIYSFFFNLRKLAHHLKHISKRELLLTFCLNNKLLYFGFLLWSQRRNYTFSLVSKGFVLLFSARLCLDDVNASLNSI